MYLDWRTTPCRRWKWQNSIVPGKDQRSWYFPLLRRFWTDRRFKIPSRLSLLFVFNRGTTPNSEIRDRRFVFARRQVHHSRLRFCPTLRNCRSLRLLHEFETRTELTNYARMKINIYVRDETNNRHLSYESLSRWRSFICESSLSQTEIHADKLI